MIDVIKTQLLALIAEVTVNPKPTYQIDGQSVHWTEYLKELQKSVDWCNRQLAETDGLVSETSIGV
ncbi:hypothetical protein FACS1894170_01930 [Planctomycetales bacterium]|nr:hypothetical protein FACS1894170_01930 [Planctomycetales bacterium]